MVAALVLVVIAGAIYARGVRAIVSRRTWPWWRTPSFFAGLACIVVALASGIDTLSSELFSVHMLQHMLLVAAAAPLLLLGAPVRPLLLGLPRPIRRSVVRPLAGNGAVRLLVHLLRHPLVAVAVYVGGIYLWHWPALYDAAVENEALHVAEHAYFLLTALLFWSVVIDPEPFRSPLPYPVRMVYLLLTGAALNTLLGGLLSFSTRLFYPHYLERTARYGMDPLTDQRVGGAIMWVLGDVVFLGAVTACFFLWLETEEREQRRREQEAGTLAR